MPGLATSSAVTVTLSLTPTHPMKPQAKRASESIQIHGSCSSPAVSCSWHLSMFVLVCNFPVGFISTSMSHERTSFIAALLLACKCKQSSLVQRRPGLTWARSIWILSDFVLMVSSTCSQPAALAWYAASQLLSLAKSSTSETNIFMWMWAPQSRPLVTPPSMEKSVPLLFPSLCS